MRFAMFYHSLVSDWNHGNAHFLRDVVGELLLRGHGVTVYEPREGWSLSNLRREQGAGPLRDFRIAYPSLRGVSRSYNPDAIDLDAELDGADAVLVHEWSDPAQVAAIGQRRAAGARFRLLFHDTHHRAVTRHTCAHRVDELMEILRQVEPAPRRPRRPARRRLAAHAGA